MNRNYFAILLIVAGLVWATVQFLELKFSSIYWPIFIIVPGLLIMVISNTFREASIGSALGAAGCATGLLLAYQSTFDHYESWAYAWSAIAPGAIGVGLFVHANRFDNPSQSSLAVKLMIAGVAWFAVGILFFEQILDISGRRIFDGGVSGFVFPALLVGVGLLVLMTRTKE